MTPRITLLFVSLHVLLYLALSFRVIARRKASKVGIGTGGDETLARAVRVHANFSEYVPIALLLLALLELSGIHAGLLWVYGALLFVARVLHAIGLGASAGVSFGRFTGAVLTFIVLLAMAITGIWRFLAPLML